jgi:hypothetical protein
VALYLQPPESPIWAEEHQPLPVESGDFELRIEGPRLRVAGSRATGVVELAHLDNADYASHPVEPHAAWRRLLETLCRRPFRPDNYEAKYLRPGYRSDMPP